MKLFLSIIVAVLAVCAGWFLHNLADDLDERRSIAVNLKRFVTALIEISFLIIALQYT